MGTRSRDYHGIMPRPIQSRGILDDPPIQPASLGRGDQYSPPIALTSIVPFRSFLCWVDPVTGSVKWQVRYFEIPISTQVTTSALERWILRREGRYSPRWQFVSDTSQTLFQTCHGCGATPPIYPFHAGEVNDAFVRVASDSEIAEFVDIIRTGTLAQQEQAVDQASNILISRAFGRDRTEK